VRAAFERPRPSIRKRVLHSQPQQVLVEALALLDDVILVEQLLERERVLGQDLLCVVVGVD
jgi:hypothetical protein